MKVQRSYSLRQRLDVVFGALLICTALAGSLSLVVALRQRQGAVLLHALHDQERSLQELTAGAEELLATRLRGRSVDPEQTRALQEAFGQFVEGLRTLRAGGAIRSRSGQRLLVMSEGAGLMGHTLTTLLARLGPYRIELDQLLSGADRAKPLSQETSQRLMLHGRALHALLQSLAIWAEERAMSEVMRAGWLQLGTIVLGLSLFVVGVFLIRHLLTVPLHRMADGIEAMRQTGRLFKLPVGADNELGVVASGFNDLAQEVETQKLRLREHIVELQRTNEEIERLSNLKDDFLTTISHQLRTPLTAIVGNLELLRDGATGPLTQDQREMVGDMSHNATRLSDLVDEALDLSLLRSGRRLLERRPDDLTALLHQAQAAWQAADGVRTIRLSCGELPQVYMDPQAVREVMDHLLRNALRHAPKHSEVVVEAHPSNGCVEVSVRDQGPGLSVEQLARVFQPFTHLHTPESPGSQGSGLGLAFCRQVIERHRGMIRADSSPGTGTTVTFTLPLASPEFLLEEACRSAKEEAEVDRGQFGLLVISPTGSDAPNASSVLRRTHDLLRCHTHRGDRFVWVDEWRLAIVAVTDRAGLAAMVGRLRSLVDASTLPVRIASASFPSDGELPHQLLEVAKRRLADPVEATGVTPS